MHSLNICILKIYCNCMNTMYPSTVTYAFEHYLHTKHTRASLTDYYIHTRLMDYTNIGNENVTTNRTVDACHECPALKRKLSMN